MVGRVEFNDNVDAGRATSPTIIAQFNVGGVLSCHSAHWMRNADIVKPLTNPSRVTESAIAYRFDDAFPCRTRVFRPTLTAVDGRPTSSCE